jgi:isoaspartyl peptidase/L-asparaginase-like protein (Ntn-hydrolase superfamily)
MDMNREGTVEGEDVVTEQEAATVARHVSHDFSSQDVDQAVAEFEAHNTERKRMAQLAVDLTGELDMIDGPETFAHLDRARSKASQIAAYLAQQAE